MTTSDKARELNELADKVSDFADTLDLWLDKVYRFVPSFLYDLSDKMTATADKLEDAEVVKKEPKEETVSVPIVGTMPREHPWHGWRD